MAVEKVLDELLADAAWIAKYAAVRWKMFEALRAAGFNKEEAIMIVSSAKVN